MKNLTNPVPRPASGNAGRVDLQEWITQHQPTHYASFPVPRPGLFILLSLILTTLSLTCCSPNPNLDEPPTIRFGEDVCEACNMIISEPRYAAAYQTLDGQVRRFDDIGDLCKFHQERKEEVAKFWVHDYATEAWLDAAEAVFVLSEDIHTPMASGVVAFADPEQAGSFAEAHHGMMMSFDQLLETYAGRASSHMLDQPSHGP